MAVTYRKSSRTIRGIKYNYGDPFVCYAANGGAATSEGSGTASALTKGTTYYYLGYAWDDDNNKLASYPYAVSTSSNGSVRGWYKENVFPYATYTIAYNANGGTGAPNSQTKTYGESLKISTQIPKKEGYAFEGWALTSADANSGKWYYQPGSTCGKNENLTLYAVWNKTDYTITYNANGGTLGEVKTQTKEHGVDLVLTGTATRTNYNLLGWSISSSATVATYSVGGDYTDDKSATLYAVWGTGYQKPRITNMSLCRVVKNADGTFTESDEGNYIQVIFTVACDGTNPTLTIWRKAVSDAEWQDTLPISISTNGVEDIVFGAGTIEPEKSYNIRIVVTDSGGSTEKSTTITSIEYPIDALAKSSESDKSGVAFGKAAELPNTAEFEYNAQFNNDALFKKPICVTNNIYSASNYGLFFGVNNNQEMLRLYQAGGSTDGNKWLAPSNGISIDLGTSPNPFKTAYVTELNADNVTTDVVDATTADITTATIATANTTNVNATNVNASGYCQTPKVYGSGNYSLKLGVANNTELVWLYQSGGSTSGSNWLSPCTSGDSLLGSSSYKWGQIWSTASTISTSDRNEKTDIANFDERHEALFAKLKPLTFKFINGTSGRTHSGFIAQDIEEALAEVGLTPLEFAAFCKDVKQEAAEDSKTGKITLVDVLDDDGNQQHIYSLRYEEFIALNTFMIQKLQAENTALKAKISAIEERLNKLEV